MGKTERHRDGAKAQNGSVGAKTNKQTKNIFRNIVIAQGAGNLFHLPKKFSDTKKCVFGINYIGTTFTKGILPLVEEPC